MHARQPIGRRTGPTMFAAVTNGMATVSFGLSTSPPLSIRAPTVLGASDAVSIVLRFSLLQIDTPDGSLLITGVWMLFFPLRRIDCSSLRMNSREESECTFSLPAPPA